MDSGAADCNVVNVFICFFTLAELLETVTLIHKPVSLQPRGLINKGNWCYINAVSFLAADPAPGHHARSLVWVCLTCRSVLRAAGLHSAHRDWAITRSACLIVGGTLEPLCPLSED